MSNRNLGRMKQILAWHDKYRSDMAPSEVNGRLVELGMGMASQHGPTTAELIAFIDKHEHDCEGCHTKSCERMQCARCREIRDESQEG